MIRYDPGFARIFVEKLLISEITGSHADENISDIPQQ
jgi:hypothetical protein